MFVLVANMPQMGTAAQNAANRRNAEKSTGPRSAAGKIVSATNALRHGAYASTAAAIPRGRFAEDQADVDAYVEGIIRSLSPRDDLELAQANRIARATSCNIAVLEFSRPRRSLATHPTSRTSTS